MAERVAGYYGRVAFIVAYTSDAVLSEMVLHLYCTSVLALYDGRRWASRIQHNDHRWPCDEIVHVH